MKNDDENRLPRSTGKTGQKRNVSDPFDALQKKAKQKREISLAPLMMSATHAVVFCWLSGAVHAAGSCYVSSSIVVDGKTKPIEPVCSALAKNLNHFCDQPPMACALKIHPNFRRQFTQPEWKPVPPDRERIEAFIRSPGKSANTTEFEDTLWRDAAPQIEAALAKKRLRFAEADVDIYNLGNKQPAYRLDLDECEAIAKSSGPGTSPDFDKNWIHHSPEVVQELYGRYFPIGVSHLNGYLFVFRGKTYNAGMWGYVNPVTGEVSSYLRVDRYERKSRQGIEQPRLVMDNICEFEYHPYEENTK